MDNLLFLCKDLSFYCTDYLPPDWYCAKMECDSCFSLMTRDAIKKISTPGLGRCSGILNGDRWHIPISLRHIENYGQCPKNKQNHPQYIGNGRYNFQGNFRFKSRASEMNLLGWHEMSWAPHFEGDWGVYKYWNKTPWRHQFHRFTHSDDQLIAHLSLP